MPLTTIGGIVVGVLALASLVFYFVHRHQEKNVKKQVNALQDERSAINRSLSRQKDNLEYVRGNLESEKNRNSVLAESLRQKKHSENELAVMKASMTYVSSKRREELRGVLIPFSEVKIDRLLGKGGLPPLFTHVWAHTSPWPQMSRRSTRL